MCFFFVAACMTLPCTGEFLDEVIYAELGEEESKTLVQKYNSQGKDAGYGPGNQNPIKSRNESRSRWQNKRESLMACILYKSNIILID